MKQQTDQLVAGIYFHPEAYPPTLNALEELSSCFAGITVVHRPHLRSVWPYPSNVRLIGSGSFMSEQEQKAASLPRRFQFFLQFTFTFLKECLRTKPAFILVYDTMSLYAYHLVRNLLRFPHTIWYHNHDVVEKTLLRKYSIGWLAAKAESSAFRYLDVFSLPTDDRLPFFPMDQFRGKYFLLPNFPSLKFYGRFYKPHPIEGTVRLIFQGQISPSRGIEYVLPLLNRKIAGRKVELSLLGSCDEQYKEEIIRQCEQNGALQHVTFDRLPYLNLPAYTTTCHVGLALLSDSSIMSATMGTASNKVFEYAALGLPVLYHGASLAHHLAPYRWAVATPLNTDQLEEKLSFIVHEYDALSAMALDDFRSKLNYQSGFSGVGNYIREALASPNNKKD